MKDKISRRAFLKIAGGAAVVSGFAPLMRHILIEPYVQPPEQELPGVANWYASTCRECAAGCGIIVRVINGRARKIEGNPLHPLNKGKLCARGQAGLQTLYNPDRLKNAVRQTGGRGSRRFEPLQWGEALDLLNDKVSSLGSPDRLAFWGGTMPAHLYTLASRLLEALGAPPPIIFDLHSALEGRASVHQHAEAYFGTPDIPIYDLARTEVIFSFGANFLETWMSPVAQSHALGTMRQGQFGGRGFMVHFEPRLSTTAASADEWIPTQPGTEGFVALAIGRIIVEEQLGHVGSHRPRAVLYQDVDVREMSQASDVPVETLRRLARIFADADQAVAIPGGFLSGQSNGFASMQAVQSLNLLAAQIGRLGGVYLPQPLPNAESIEIPQVDSFERVQELLQRMKSNQVDVLLIHGTNPMFDLPGISGIEEALANVPFIVSFSPFVDETAVRTDLILPDHTPLESWGFDVPAPGANKPILSGQQPAVRPLYDTRATADVLLQLASQLGGAAAEALPWPDEAAFLQEIVTELHGSSLNPYEARTAAGFWSLWRQYGGWWSETDILKEPEVTGIVQQSLPVKDSQFEGSPESFPYYLYPYPSMALSDGRGANLPWLQETPDPMTTACWGTWIELNTNTAHSLGVDNGDIVRVISPFGELEAPVVVYPGIRPDVVAIPVGQGHSDYGRFAAQRGSNPISLLSTLTDGDSGALSWGATRVQLEPTGQKRTLARLENLHGEGRETLR